MGCGASTSSQAALTAENAVLAREITELKARLAATPADAPAALQPAAPATPEAPAAPLPPKPVAATAENLCKAIADGDTQRALALLKDMGKEEVLRLSEVGEEWILLRDVPASGTRVRRGRDWNYTSDQDGGAGKTGVVTGPASTGWVKVKWDARGSDNYRCGAGGKYDLEKANGVRGTALHAAAHHGTGGGVISRLLDLGGRELLEQKDGGGQTARERATAAGRTDAVAEIDRWVAQQAAWEQAEARTSSFLAAARDNDLATLKTLVARDVNILYVQDAAGCSALHRAVEGGHADVVAYLLQQGGLRLASLTTTQGLTARDLAVLQHKTAVAPQLQCTPQRDTDRDKQRAELETAALKAQELAAHCQAVLDSQMAHLDPASLQAQTALEASDKHEAKYLLKYQEEQAKLRETAAAALRAGAGSREKHARIIQEQTAQLRAVEAELRSHNLALEQAMAAIHERHTSEQTRFRALQERVASLQADYARTYDAAVHPLTPAEHGELVKACLLSDAKHDGDHSQKFLSDPKTLVIGQFEDAAGGLAELCCVDEDEINGEVAKGVEALRAEVEAFGNPEVLDQLRYVVDEVSSEKECPHGIRDKDKGGRRLRDWMKDRNATESGIKEGEVAALRIYTTDAFKHINGPLRDQERLKQKKRHPLAVLTTLLSRGIKKLRKVGASNEAATTRQVLYRGMRNVDVTEQFIKRGGTELGAMSTTTDLGVAIEYARSRRSLIFKIVTQNNLQRGADLQWLSAFPNEAEILFPPLTYMQPNGKTQVIEIDGYHFTIVEVHTTTA